MMLHQHTPADAAAGNVVSDLILGVKVMLTFSSKRSLLINARTSSSRTHGKTSSSSEMSARGDCNCNQFAATATATS
jgi:hypothetical protein